MHNTNLKLLTGYSALTSSLPYPPSPEIATENVFLDLVDRFIDTTQCSYSGWKGPSPNPARESKEALHHSELFSRLPWLTPTLSEKFESPNGMIKVMSFNIGCFGKLTITQEAIQALEIDFLASITSTAENSRAYLGALLGQIPDTSTKSESHVASRLLTISFLDIVCSLDEPMSTDMDEEVVQQKVAMKGLESIVR
jgi:hypothetical protein